MKPPTLGSLFAGIGGIDLGFERAGFETKWQVEIDPFCRRVLEKQFPNAKRHTDVREVGVSNLEPVDVLAGGFPCQDISEAGLKVGIEGSRSGLWSEMFRIICELRPSGVLVENVAALLRRGMGRVLGDLASIGYDAEWDCLPAAAFGAPHRRDRVFIFAHPQCEGLQGRVARKRIFESKTEAFAKHSYAGLDRRNALDLFAAGLPSVDGLSVEMVRRRIRTLGNAVHPGVSEWIAGRILEVRKMDKGE